jgi:hypothetical protein
MNETIRAAAREIAPRLLPIDIEQLVVEHTAAGNAANAAGRQPEVSIADFIELQDALIRELLDYLDVRA